MSKQLHDELDYGIKIDNDETDQAKKPKLYPQLPANSTFRSNGSHDEMQPQKENQQYQINQSDYDLSSAAHPIACIFTFAFKVSAFVIYFFLSWIFSNIITFILVVTLSALDFWTVKNVTGRLLVGLRWWSDYDSEGKEIWKFQSYDTEFKSNPVDKAFFWTSQALSTLVWIVFLIITVIGFKPYWVNSFQTQALLNFINLSLSATNLYGYYKCKGEHSKKVGQLKKKLGQQGLIHMAQKFL